MVCDGVDLKWVTLCLSRRPEGGGSGAGGRERQKLLLGFQVTVGDGYSKEVTRIVADRDRFPDLSQMGHKRADKFLLCGPSWVRDSHKGIVPLTQHVMQTLPCLRASAEREGKCDCCWGLFYALLSKLII